MQKELKREQIFLLIKENKQMTNDAEIILASS